MPSLAQRPHSTPETRKSPPSAAAVPTRPKTRAPSRRVVFMMGVIAGAMIALASILLVNGRLTTRCRGGRRLESRPALHPTAPAALMMVSSGAPRDFPLVTRDPTGLTPEECARIIRLGASHASLGDGEVGMVMPNKTYSTGSSAKLRRARVASLSKDAPEMAWIYDRMFSMVRRQNEGKWRFPIPDDWRSPRVESLQFTRYTAADRGHYDWHVDIGASPTNSWRRLSVTAQLSSPDEYDGGDLEIRITATAQTMDRRQGATLIFPSFVPHRVAPVTRGVRHSLVMWVEENDLMVPVPAATS